MQSIPMERTQAQVQVNAFVRSVYNWMAIGLALTGAVAWFVAHNEPVLRFVYQARWIFFIGELALVFMLASRVHKMKASTATGNVYVLCSPERGYDVIHFSGLYHVVHRFDLFHLRRDFCRLQHLWLGDQTRSHRSWQLLVHGIDRYHHRVHREHFLKSPAMQMIISYIGVLIFTGLTAYDTQKLKAMAISQPAGLDAAVVRKGSIIGALTLYLGFHSDVSISADDFRRQPRLKKNPLISSTTRIP
jgi:hypothetical protein